MTTPAQPPGQQRTVVFVLSGSIVSTPPEYLDIVQLSSGLPDGPVIVHTWA